MDMRPINWIVFEEIMKRKRYCERYQDKPDSELIEVVQEVDAKYGDVKLSKVFRLPEPVLMAGGAVDVLRDRYPNKRSLETATEGVKEALVNLGIYRSPLKKFSDFLWKDGRKINA